MEGGFIVIFGFNNLGLRNEFNNLAFVIIGFLA
jgi:hypothetical protein